MLLNQGANKEIQTNDYGASYRQLLDRGADMEAKDCDGCSPLVLATIVYKLYCYMKLIGKGANLWYVAPDGMTVFYHYYRGENSETTYLMNKEKKIAIDCLKSARDVYVKRRAEVEPCCQRFAKYQFELPADVMLVPCRCFSVSQLQYCSKEYKDGD